MRKPGKEKKKQFESQVIFWENFAEQLYRVDFFPFYFSGPLKLEFKVHGLKKKKRMCLDWLGLYIKQTTSLKHEYWLIIHIIVFSLRIIYISC